MPLFLLKWYTYLCNMPDCLNNDELNFNNYIIRQICLNSVNFKLKMISKK